MNFQIGEEAVDVDGKVGCVEARWHDKGEAWILVLYPFGGISDAPEACFTRPKKEE